MQNQSRRSVSNLSDSRITLRVGEDVGESEPRTATQSTGWSKLSGRLGTPVSAFEMQVAMNESAMSPLGTYQHLCTGHRRLKQGCPCLF